MSPNSQAYRDAWKRVRDAIKAEADARQMDVSDAFLDDAACEATYAAFGLYEDRSDN